tara:strand:+ start:7286 stop:8317 length:1032 start_codon:yes stop_codon:yes gene_type:complete
MASELEVLRTLRELRAHAADKRRAEREWVLTKMSIDQARSAEFGQRLQVLNTVNEQLMTSHADDFVTTTGIGAVYQSYIGDGEDLDNVIDELEDQYNLNRSQANRVASALYGYYEGQNTKGVLSIAEDIASTVQKSFEGEEISKDDKRMTKALYSLTPLGADSEKGLKALSSVQKVMQNRNDLLAEMTEYGTTGDIDITRDIGIFEPDSVSEELDAFAGIDPPESPGIDGLIMSPEEDISSSIENIDELSNTIKQKQESLNTLDLNVRYINQKSRHGITLTDNEENLLVRAPEIESLFRAEMDDLNKSITEFTKKRRAVEAAKFEQISEKYPGLEGTGVGGLF